MDMAPSCRGETRIPAVEERMRYRPSSVGGSGAGLRRSDMLIRVRGSLFSEETAEDS